MWAAVRAVFHAILSDRAAALLLFGAPILYSVFYPSAYTGEVAVRAPTVVVDLDRSTLSRTLIGRVRATQQAEVVAELASPLEARAWLADGRAVAALVIPADFGARVAQGRVGQVALYGHGGYLLRASTALSGIGAALAATGRDAAREQARAQGPPAPPALTLVTRPLFNPTQGYGAAVFPGVAFVILNQTLVIGLALLAATARERLGAPACLSARQVAGVALAFGLIGLADVGWFAGFAFWLQDYPRAAARPADLIAAALVMTAATVAFALLLASLFRTRERPLQLWLATSLPLFFLAGLSWPPEAMPPALAVVARLFPTTPGLDLMIGLNQLGGTLGAYRSACWNLLGLAVVYSTLATVRLSARA